MDTLFNPFIDARIRANFAIRNAFPPSTERNWKPRGTKNIPNSVMPNIIIGIIWLRLRLRPVTVERKLFIAALQSFKKDSELSLLEFLTKGIAICCSSWQKHDFPLFYPHTIASVILSCMNRLNQLFIILRYSRECPLCFACFWL